MRCEKTPTCSHPSAADQVCAACHCLAADYRKLQVFDTSELKSLQALLSDERDRVASQREIAKEEQRKVLRVDCDLDLKRIDRINKWVEHIYNDSRRTW